MTRKQKRMATIAGLGAVLVVAAGLVLFALRDQIVFFYSPSEIAESSWLRLAPNPSTSGVAL